ncbi:MAG: glycerophosphodiester phosphodiesterase [Candidatus Dormibacteraeota bacterium]|nr:glycerophosphodiester phosphodiesterase [Candidatus Dormibacteraeota bacterium]
MGLVGHAGLAPTRVGGSPTRASLQRALRLGVHALEVDLCASADYSLVLHHDTRLPVGLPVRSLTLAQLRRVEPALLTLDDAAEIVGDRTHLILDVKTRAAAGPVSDWFCRRGATPNAVVCSGRLDVLRYLARATPAAALWQTFPDIGERPYEGVLRVLSSVAAHRGRHALQLVGDLWDVLARVSANPAQAATQIIGLPWRRRMPLLLERGRDEFAARGVALHHALVTPDLCSVAHELDMTVVAWTVNSPTVARQAAACGVDLITTDDVAGIRRALGARRVRSAQVITAHSGDPRVSGSRAAPARRSGSRRASRGARA